MNLGEENGWFADVAQRDEPTPAPSHPWQPVLQTTGMCLSFDIWFSSERECTDWIRANVVGQGMADD